MLLNVLGLGAAWAVFLVLLFVLRRGNSIAPQVIKFSNHQRHRIIREESRNGYQR